MYTMDDWELTVTGTPTKESLRKLSRFSQSGGQSSNNLDNVVSEHESKSEYGSNTDDSDFIVDEENLIHDVAIDMQDFNNTYVNVEWTGCKESVQEKNDKLRVRLICRGKLSVFTIDGPSVDDGRSNTNWPSEASGSAKSKKGTKDSGNLKSKKGLKDSNGCHWVLQCSKLENEETWKGKTFDDIHKCLWLRAGVIPALAEMYLYVEHRYCLKHIYDNMKLTWRGRDHTDILLNNMCEVSNRQRMDGRDKPIITCLEFIREYLMKRIVNVQLVIRKCNGPLTLNAERLFKVILKDAAQIKVDWNGGSRVLNRKLMNGRDKPIITCLEFIRENLMKRIVNVELVIRKCNGPLTINVERFKVNPCDGPDLWPKSNLPGILTPPNYTPQLGRPKKKIRKSASELDDSMAKGGKLTREGKSVTCTKCGQVGHNQRSCKGYKSTNVGSQHTSQTAKKLASGSDTPTGSQAVSGSQLAKKPIRGFQPASSSQPA
ncbi:mutator type transposase [Tanacetum coccineum]